MRVHSFMRKGIDLESVEVEVSMVPGLPTFHLIGLPDSSIRESVMRIKSALRHQGFKLPTHEQVLIHLKPSHEKKSSQGLDLAIAAAYLWKTEQLPRPAHDSDLFLYGEVSLEGRVSAPQDLDLLEQVPQDACLITGRSSENFRFRHGRVDSIHNLANVSWHESQAREQVSNQEPCRFSDFDFGLPLAHLLSVAATGEHNVFVAGPAGTGKTTFAETLHSLLRPPTAFEQQKIDKIGKITGSRISGRPFISPHHGTSDIALLGGGVPPRPGEITRAQHGVLVLDEFLEYKYHVKESLREPIEKHEITVSRAGAKVTFPADFLLIGTSNLCPCGDYVPTLEPKCGHFSSHCKSFYRRLSGPLLDRFEIVTFSHVWKVPQTRSYNEIEQVVRQAQKYALESRGQSKMNSRLTLRECEALIPPFVRKNLLPELPGSHRRLLALYRVARTLADLEGKEKVSGRHIEGAKELTITPFKDIKNAWR